MLRVLKSSLLVAVLILVSAAHRSLHSQVSVYVPLDDNAYTYADALISRGRLSSLSLLERPYRVSDFKKAMEADTAVGSRNIQRLYDALENAIAKYDIAEIEPGREGLRYTVIPYLIATQQSSGLRELMLADSTRSLRPGFGGVGIAQIGPLVAVARAYNDARLKDDPEFTGITKNWYVGRMEESYLSTQFKFGEVFLGRMGRNWGTPQMDGLVVGNAAYSYDHLYVKLGVPSLRLSSVITRLDNQVRVRPTAIDSANRFFSAHQLAVRLGNFEASVSEAVIYGGRNETLQPAYANPVVPYILTQTLEKIPGNILFGLDLAYRSRFGNFNAQGTLDDVAKDRCGPPCTKPNSYAFTFGAEGVPIWQDQRLFASYTLVSNLMYRNTSWESHYISRDVSLGRGFSDYEEVRVGADLLVVPTAPLRLYIARRRQGEGDYRQAHPDIPDYPVTQQFLQGVVQKTYRVGLSGAGTVASYVQIKGDIGYNTVSNSQHVAGAKKSSFAGRVKVTVDSPWRLKGVFSTD